MGINIELQDENGCILASVANEQDTLARLLPDVAPSDNVITHIDRYGDTTFNRLQMTVFLPAWEVLCCAAVNEQQAALMLEVKKLADRCRSEVHLYLKFIGD